MGTFPNSLISSCLDFDLITKGIAMSVDSNQIRLFWHIVSYLIL